MKHAVGSAPGKIILMGEHSVVYGKPAIAMPFHHVGVKCTVEPHQGDLIIKSYCFDGLVKMMPKTLKGIQKLIEVTLDYLDKESKDIKIIIESTIPAQRGLGSSAAVSVAIVRALFNAFEIELDFKTLNELVFVAESIHHKNPSGLDTNTILNERFVMFDIEKGISFIDAKLQGFLVIADTGQVGHTKVSVDNVRKQLESNPKETIETIDALGRLTMLAKGCILNDDLECLGKYMHESHYLLKKLGVSDHILDTMVDVSMLHGSLGAKLTGGGNGGSIIALAKTMVDAKNISDALIAQNAAHTWIYHLSEV